MFIYLEIIAMIQIYYTQHRLPIRFPIYIAIVALARYIILDSKSLAQGAVTRDWNNCYDSDYSRFNCSLRACKTTL